MEQPIFIFWGVVSMLTTFAIWVKIIDPRTMIVATMMWAVWGFGATSVQTTSECCVVTETYWSLALIGWSIGLVAFVFWIGALTGNVEAEREELG